LRAVKAAGPGGAAHTAGTRVRLDPGGHRSKKSDFFVDGVDSASTRSTLLSE
jgi:hypothetical protein